MPKVLRGPRHHCSGVATGGAVEEQHLGASLALFEGEVGNVSLVDEDTAEVLELRFAADLRAGCVCAAQGNSAAGPLRETVQRQA